jgi:hypothetical protein
MGTQHGAREPHADSILPIVVFRWSALLLYVPGVLGLGSRPGDHLFGLICFVDLLCYCRPGIISQTAKSSSFWDVTPCSPLKTNGRFGETHYLHLQGRRIRQAKNYREAGSKQTLGALSRHLPGGLKKTTKSLSHDSRCPARDSNWAPHEYKSVERYTKSERSVERYTDVS